MGKAFRAILSTFWARILPSIASTDFMGAVAAATVLWASVVNSIELGCNILQTYTLHFIRG